MLTTYFGLESPAARAPGVVGGSIPVADGQTPLFCEPYGLTLSAAIIPILTFDAFHEECQRTIVELLLGDGAYPSL